MNYKDQWVTDEQGKKFVFTVEMQRRLAEAGLPVEAASIADFKAKHAPPPAPTREQREQRREERRDERRQQPERSEEIEVDEMTGKFIGRLIMFNPHKGFGFITRGADKIYFHEKKAMDDPKYLSEGQKLLYTLNEYRGKEEAIDVEEFE